MLCNNNTDYGQFTKYTNSISILNYSSSYEGEFSYTKWNFKVRLSAIVIQTRDEIYPKYERTNE